MALALRLQEAEAALLKQTELLDLEACGQVAELLELSELEGAMTEAAEEAGEVLMGLELLEVTAELEEAGQSGGLLLQTLEAAAVEAGELGMALRLLQAATADQGL